MTDEEKAFRAGLNAGCRPVGAGRWQHFEDAEWEKYLAAKSPSASPDSGEAVCEDCGGNGWSGGVQPRDKATGELIGDLCDACEVCLGSGTVPSPSPAIVKEAGEIERLREALEEADYQAFLALELGLNNGGAVAWRDGLSRVQEVFRAVLSASNAEQVSK